MESAIAEQHRDVDAAVEVAGAEIDAFGGMDGVGTEQQRPVAPVADAVRRAAVVADEGVEPGVDRAVVVESPVVGDLGRVD